MRIAFRMRALFAALCSALLFGAAFVQLEPARAAVFQNATSFTIPSVGAASVYPSQIVVAGLSGPISDVNVTLAGLNHGWPLDLEILLVAPNGAKVHLMSDTCSTVDFTNRTLTFDDQAASNMSSGNACANASYRPTAGGPVDSLPAPAPANPYSSTLSALNGSSANGTWSLYVADDDAGETGSVTNGWSLDITTVAAPPAETNLIYNGNFTSNLDGWGFWGTSYSVASNQLSLTRQNIHPDGGFFQFVSFAPSAGMSFELNAILKNGSVTSKMMNLMVRSSDWSQVYNCYFNLPANTGEGNYTMRFKLTGAMSPMVLQGWLTGDNNPGFRVDSIDLRYKPSMDVPATQCLHTPGNVNLLFGGNMDGNIANSFAWWNSTASAVSVSGNPALQITRNAGTPDGGFYQWNPYPAPQNAVFDLTLNIGNTSNFQRTVHILARNTDWSETRSCWVNIPANTPLSAYSMSWRTTNPWQNIVLQWWLQDNTGTPALRFDSIALYYRPYGPLNQDVYCNFSGLEAAAAPAPMLIAPLELPAGTIAVAPIDPAQMGEGGITAAAPAVSEQPAPVVEAPVAVEEAKPGE